MPVVSNASPILNLAIIGRLFLLRDQFGQLAIPQAVLDELRIEEDMPGSQAMLEAVEDGWIRVVAVDDRALVQVLQQGLDKGESEAIALALQLNATWILLDERDGRKVAKSLGLGVTGVLGVVLRAYQANQLTSIQDALDALRDQAGFHINVDLYDDLLQQDTKR